jgi:YfiH family protein
VSEIEIITPDWKAPPGVRAAFTLRRGGVSTGAYESLNIASHVDDVPAAVLENRKRVRAELMLPAEPVWLEQIHGVAVADLDQALPLRRADAAVAHIPDRICAIQVADCMPVLFATHDGLRIGAAHAGWRGLAGGVLEGTVAAMHCMPGRLIAWLGPCIGPENFEVGDDVREAFVSRDSQVQDAFERNARGRWQCDLYAIARRKLSRLGIADVRGGGWCTFSEPARFFSYRRDGQCGRMAALIWRDSRVLRSRAPQAAAAKQVEDLEHA